MTQLSQFQVRCLIILHKTFHEKLHFLDTSRSVSDAQVSVDIDGLLNELLVDFIFVVREVDPTLQGEVTSLRNRLTQSNRAGFWFRILANFLVLSLACMRKMR